VVAGILGAGGRSKEYTSCQHQPLPAMPTPQPKRFVVVFSRATHGEPDETVGCWKANVMKTERSCDSFEQQQEKIPM